MEIGMQQTTQINKGETHNSYYVKCFFCAVLLLKMRSSTQSMNLFHASSRGCVFEWKYLMAVDRSTYLFLKTHLIYKKKTIIYIWHINLKNLINKLPLNGKKKQHKHRLGFHKHQYKRIHLRHKRTFDDMYIAQEKTFEMFKERQLKY